MATNKRLQELMRRDAVRRKSYRHTHPELTDPHLRAVMANELLVLRRSLKPFNRRDPWVAGILLGIETMARRVQDVERAGIAAVYGSKGQTA